MIPSTVKTIPFFSIITVVLNDLSGLKKTRNSIAKQNFQNFEWIVVDGDSNDGSAEFATNEKIICVKQISEKDSGIYDAMNKGIELSSGRYILFFNAGEIFPNPLVLGKVESHIQKFSEMSDIILGGATLIFNSGLKVYRGPKNIDSYIWHGCPASHQATYYNRRRLIDTKYDISFRICGDYCITAKLHRDGAKATYIDKSLVDFKVGGASYIHPIRQMLEPIRIQRNILELSYVSVCKSFIKRLVSTAGLRVYSNAFVGRFLSMLIAKKRGYFWEKEAGKTR